MRLFKNRHGYDFWIGAIDDVTVYNITPAGSKKPNAGFVNPQHICRIKNVPENSFDGIIAGEEILLLVETELRRKDMRLTDANFVNQIKKMSFK